MKSITEQVRTLVYVEDDAANRELVERIAARHPHLCLLTAVDGEMGVSMSRATLPDLILMDINLPGINGYQALKLLRSDPVTAHIPVVAVSAHTLALDIDRGLQAGFFHYVTKPIVVVEFMRVVNLALEFARVAKVTAQPA